MKKEPRRTESYSAGREKREFAPRTLRGVRRHDIRVQRENYDQNRGNVERIRYLMRQLYDLTDRVERLEGKLNSYYSAVDRASSQNSIHDNKAARLKAKGYRVYEEARKQYSESGQSTDQQTSDNTKRSIDRTRDSSSFNRSSRFRFAPKMSDRKRDDERGGVTERRSRFNNEERRPRFNTDARRINSTVDKEVKSTNLFKSSGEELSKNREENSTRKTITEEKSEQSIEQNCDSTE